MKIPGRETTPGEMEVSEVITYTVKSGDTLNSIANKYGISVDEIVNLNNLTSGILTVGQNILLPLDTIDEPIIEEENNIPGTTTTTYTVKSGDTLYSIANNFGTTVANLKTLNNLTSNSLSIGQILKISDSNEITSPTTPTTPSETYTVKSGDTLYSIANKYGITVNEIKNLNGLSSNLLSIGQVIKIPTTNTSISENNTIPETYTVKSGDTLYSIANKYNTTVSKLKTLNNLTSNTLSIGQVLKLR